jgi:transcriptional regulator with XRE-family HTH domain
MREDKEANEHPDHGRLFQFARLELEVTELFCELMEKENVTRAELARRLGVSSAYVTKVLRGQSNLTLKTVSDFLFALGRSARVVDRHLIADSPPLLVVEPRLARRTQTRVRQSR